MKMTSKDRAVPLMRKENNVNENSLAFLAKQHGIPIGTLKTRIKRFTDKGIDRDKAIDLAIKLPKGPQGRPRQQ